MRSFGSYTLVCRGGRLCNARLLRNHLHTATFARKMRTIKFAVALTLSLTAGCKRTTEVEKDAKTNESAICETDTTCDDGLFCNGVELCLPNDDAADKKGCVAGEAPECSGSEECAPGSCDDNLGECVLKADAARDGHDSVKCLDNRGEPIGADCDDDDPNRFPNNYEVCDDKGHDEDCDPETIGGRDDDGDGFINTVCCNTNSKGESVCGDDCDDTNKSVHPLATEVCDHVDNNCRDGIDEGVKVLGFEDLDHDFAGNSSRPIEACAGSKAFATLGGDCDDEDPDRSPYYKEACDEVDNNCNGEIDEDPSPSIGLKTLMETGTVTFARTT